MAVVKETTRCPFCREVIAADATRCRHCHADLSGARGKKSPLAVLNTFRTGFLTGVLFTLVLGILIYWQFFGGE